MKLVELKCNNCGAQLKVEEGTSQVKCEFCGSTFSVDDAYNEGYKYTKGVLKARSEQMEEDFNKAQDLMDSFIGKPSRVFSIAFVAIFILIFAFIGYHMYVGFSDSRNSRDSFEIDSFNTPYETDAGKRSGFFIVGTLDDIVTNNKTNKSHIIAVVYNGITATEEKSIKEIAKGKLVTEELLRIAKENIKMIIESSLDSNISILNSYIFKEIDNSPLFEEKLKMLKDITLQDIIDCAKLLKINTIYELRPGEINEGN